MDDYIKRLTENLIKDGNTRSEAVEDLDSVQVIRCRCIDIYEGICFFSCTNCSANCFATDEPDFPSDLSILLGRKYNTTNDKHRSMSAADDLMSLTSLIDNQSDANPIWSIIGDKKPKVNWSRLTTRMVCCLVFCELYCWLVAQGFLFTFLSGQQIALHIGEFDPRLQWPY